MTQLVLISLLFFGFNSLAEVIVKTDSVTISGYSAKSADSNTYYGGIAGSACTGDATNTCNSCTDTAGLNACNQASVYSGMKISVSFKVTKTVTNAVAKLFIEGATTGDYSSPVVTLAAANYTLDSSVITMQTTWAELCGRSASGVLNSSCVETTGDEHILTKGVKFGVDADNSGDVDPATEVKSVTFKLHFIKSGAATTSQNFCSGTAAGAGICSINFLAGDQKAFIDTAKFAGADATSTMDWESITVFPVAVNTGGEVAAYTSFTNGAVAPQFKAVDTSGNIPDSQISAGLTNYQKYCMVYATKNLAQNIYKYVIPTTPADEVAITAASCVTPSEVVGILEDKRCFISTAAFGSESAPQVEIFRKFRDQFLLKNYLGKAFVKFYYNISPPMADAIANNEFLKSATRALLYPFLIFATLSLKIGFLLSAVLLAVLLLITVKLSSYVKNRNAFLVLLIIFFTNITKAEVVPQETIINHPNAQEGLVRIKKDGTYIYDLKRPLKKESSHIRFGQANYPEITINIEQTDASGNPTGIYNEYNFQDFYSQKSGFIFGYDYENFFSIDSGKLGWQAGFSAMVVSGNGRFVGTPPPGNVSTESYTFATLPFTLGGTYRLEWKDKQMLAPYASGGATYVLLAEKRADVAKPSLAGGLGFYAAAGGLLNLSIFDSDTSFQLDSEYGISNMWLSLEFRIVEVKSGAFSFSNRYLNAGLSFDF